MLLRIVIAAVITAALLAGSALSYAEEAKTNPKIQQDKEQIKKDKEKLKEDKEKQKEDKKEMKKEMKEEKKKEHADKDDKGSKDTNKPATTK